VPRVCVVSLVRERKCTRRDTHGGGHSSGSVASARQRTARIYQAWIGDPEGATDARVVGILLGLWEQAERALSLLEEAKGKGVVADAAMYGAVVRCCARSARPVDAEATAATATAAGASLSVATHNTLMGMYLRAPSEGHRAKAAAVYARLKASGLSADASTCATFMACCEKDARWAEAKAAFEEMKASGVEAPAAACAVYETALARLAGDSPAPAEAKTAAKAAAKATGEKKAEKAKATPAPAEAKESKKATQLSVSAKEFVPGGK